MKGSHVGWIAILLLSVSLSFTTKTAAFSGSLAAARSRRNSLPCTKRWLSSSSEEVRVPSALSDGFSKENKAQLEKCDDEAVKNSKFDLGVALFCAGLAFDAYVEPPSNSSRWEKGSKGMNVAFVSQAFTRNLYKGMLEVKVEKIYDLPDEDDTAEGIMTGGGVDASLLVAAVEGHWKEDIQMLQRESYHDGVLGLLGAAHVGKSRTAWANVNANQSKNHKKKLLKQQTKNENEDASTSQPLALPYHIPSSWGKGGQAVYEDEPPFYLYIQEPSNVQLVFTVMDDDVVGEGSPVGSANNGLVRFIPNAAYSGAKLIERLKKQVVPALIKQQQSSNSGPMKPDELLQSPAAQEMLQSLILEKNTWEGEIKLTSKPRKKDKNGQVAMGAAAGAMVAGPVGAAAGAFLGSLYEGDVRGRIMLQLRYLPLPPVGVERKVYKVKGGLPGIEWGEMYEKFLKKQANYDDEEQQEILMSSKLGGSDLEHCFFINHEETGGCCAVYRSLEKKLIVVSFRGTCVPKDLITDASIAQDAWVEGEDVNEEGVAKVHSGFRKSMNSISRRLKELILAAPAPGEDISQYDMLVTGHSLGGALSTLFAMDIAEFGIDAGRALPQKAPSDAWWKSIVTTLTGNNAVAGKSVLPPRPKSLKMYNFGSPRVGNPQFSARFQSMLEKDGGLDEAYRIVNGEDLVARHPRTMNALAFGSVEYDHCGATVLVSVENTDEDENGEPVLNPRVWIEGESDEGRCPVRDGTPLTSPLANGTLLADLLDATTNTFMTPEGQEDKTHVRDYAKNLQELASKVSGRLQTFTATDLTSVFGIDREFAEREARMIQSITSGEGLGDHMEDKYYGSMGRASGFIAKVGEELQEV